MVLWAAMKKGARLVSVGDYEAAAKAKLPQNAYDFVAGGAADEISIRWNREGYDRKVLRPRVLRDVSKIDTRVKLFDLDLPHPILLAPAAYQKLLHKDGELAAARGAGATNTTYVVSSNANVAIEDIAKVATSPLWLQLY